VSLQKKGQLSMETVKKFTASGEEWELRINPTLATGLLRHMVIEVTDDGLRQIPGTIKVRVRIQGDVSAPLPVMVDAETGAPIDFAELLKPWKAAWARLGGGSSN
jgi:hypothetical protein